MTDIGYHRILHGAVDRYIDEHADIGPRLDDAEAELLKKYMYERCDFEDLPEELQNKVHEMAQRLQEYEHWMLRDVVLEDISRRVREAKAPL